MVVVIIIAHNALHFFLPSGKTEPVAASSATERSEMQSKKTSTACPEIIQTSSVLISFFLVIIDKYNNTALTQT
jgi:hypothetical protein